MNDRFQTIIQTVKEHLEVEVSEFRNEVTLLVAPEKIVEACRALKEACGFQLLIDETAVDYCPQESFRFHVVYHLYSIKEALDLNVRVPLAGDDPHIPTVETVYPNANWYEREIWDMFGIHFDGHSDLRRILMPPDWQSFPLRKDSPLGYEEVAFTFDTEEINRAKPHAKE